MLSDGPALGKSGDAAAGGPLSASLAVRFCSCFAHPANPIITQAAAEAHASGVARPSLHTRPFVGVFILNAPKEAGPSEENFPASSRQQLCIIVAREICYNSTSVAGTHRCTSLGCSL